MKTKFKVGQILRQGSTKWIAVVKSVNPDCYEGEQWNAEYPRFKYMWLEPCDWVDAKLKPIPNSIWVKRKYNL